MKTMRDTNGNFQFKYSPQITILTNLASQFNKLLTSYHASGYLKVNIINCTLSLIKLSYIC